MKKNKKKIPNHKLLTRRDFLAQGLIAGTGSVLMPSLVSLLSNDLLAEEIQCNPSSSTPRIPFITLDLAGGYPFAQDFTPGGRGGQTDLLTSYRIAGIPDSLKYGAIRNGQPIQFDNTYGLRMHPDSAFLRGMNAFLPAQYRSNVDGFIICGTSNDDTNINPHNAGYLISAAGRTGTLLAGVGSENTSSGGNAIPSLGSENSIYRPVQVRDRNSAQRVVDKGDLATILRSDAKYERLRSVIKSLSTSKLQQFHNLNLEQQIKTLAECGYVNLERLMTQFQPTDLFPNPVPANSALAMAFPNTNAHPDLTNYPTAAVANLVMQGFAGVGTISIGGFDSHSNGSTVPNARDTRAKGFEAGAEVGRLIHFAALLNKPIFINVVTDGGMGMTDPDPNSTTSDFTTNPLNPTVGDDGCLARPGDNGQTGISVVFAYFPGAARGSFIRADSLGRQVGAFTTNGVDQNYLIMASNNPSNMAKVVALNYLALDGREAMMKDLPGNLGLDPFSGSNYSKYLIFKPPA